MMIQENTRKLQEIEITYAREKEKIVQLEESINSIVSRKEKINKELEEIENKKQDAINKKQDLQENVKNINEQIEIISKEIEEFANLNKDNQKYIDDLNLDITNLKISVSSFDPNFIVIVPQRKVILNKYPEQGMTFNGVDSIMDGAFMDSKIKHITIPSTIKKIPDFCFAGCKNLVSVTLGDSIDYIGKYALAGTSITEITLPKNLKHIWYNSFKNTNLQKIME